MGAYVTMQPKSLKDDCGCNVPKSVTGVCMPLIGWYQDPLVLGSRAEIFFSVLFFCWLIKHQPSGRSGLGRKETDVIAPLYCLSCCCFFFFFFSLFPLLLPFSCHHSVGTPPLIIYITPADRRPLIPTHTLFPSFRTFTFSHSSSCNTTTTLFASFCQSNHRTCDSPQPEREFKREEERHLSYLPPYSRFRLPTWATAAQLEPHRELQ
ncbi:hypothetical protein FN846DRAFT_168620 [Sphaerosporella brunnea]|uniref:Uncharacterized protein n=1 Tax=Sphaerosporella brunnea TaxID=1250544 RepID=A0A5J5EPK0_9PEZI|nr:hypothetical protein FN846DRAFT_168620 [Sphaerosporella brunnea]